MKACAHRSFCWFSSPLAIVSMVPLLLLFTGCGGAHFTAPAATPTVNIAASPAKITTGSSAMLTVTATDATSLTVSGSDGSSYTMSASGGSQAVSPTATTTYTAKAVGGGGNASSATSVTVAPAAPAPAPTVTLSADPTSVTAGGSSTLTVTATNATAVTVTGSDGNTYQLQPGGGNQVVKPSATATYTASATGAGGKASAVATVTVTPATPATKPSVAISAKPTSITAGQSSTVTVTAANATAVTVTGSDGSSFNLTANGGTQVVSPATTTTYTANATGAGGNTSAAATVTVVSGAPPPAAPTVTMVANPTTISSGGSSTLTVGATSATAVKVTGSDGSSYNLAASGGTQGVSPAGSTTYTATATGAGGMATAVTTVTVVPVAPPPGPTVVISANPTSITAGGSSTLTVGATNATTLVVTGSDGSSYNLAASGGIQAVAPAGSTTYTATATGAGGMATAVTTVTVVPVAPPPGPTVAISANPTSITAGASSTLTVAATNATAVKVTGSDGSSYNLTASGGVQAVTPAATTTYTAVATGTAGSASAVTTVTVVPPAPTVTITAVPASITTGASSTLTVAATNATTVVVTGSDSSSYTLAATGGTQVVSPASTTTYTAEASGASGNASATATVTVTAPGNVQSINHVIFMLQENHTFDNYFGMLNPYRRANGWNIGDDGKDYEVDGIDDKLNISNENDQGVFYPLFKLRSTCIDDDSSEWQASYGDVSRYDYLTSRKISQNGFVHTAGGFATYCANSGHCNGAFTDLAGQRAMGYYDQDYLNYYYYMASQFAVSDRWFSPLASKSTPNRVATFTGGTTEGLVRDPGTGDDKLGGVAAEPIFQELDQANVSWKVYYTQTAGSCLAGEDCGTGSAAEPATDLGYLFYDTRYLYKNSPKVACTGTTQHSSVVGDLTDSFCIDPNHIAPLTTYFTDVANGTLASFTFIESGSINDEHPGSGQSVLVGQSDVANIVNAFMASASWKDSVFFFSYDEGGGPYDHVPPVPGHSNDFTDAALLPIPDIATISVNPDSYAPCLPSTLPATPHCDLKPNYPGTHPGDAATVHGFAAQLGFRLPNIVISPFTRRHYVSHIPMDHTAIIKFVESRFVSPTAHLTARDAVQPDLLDFFDFTNTPWATPPTPPAPVTAQSLGYNPCTPAKLGP